MAAAAEGESANESAATRTVHRRVQDTALGLPSRAVTGASGRAVDVGGLLAGSALASGRDGGEGETGKDGRAGKVG